MNKIQINDIRNKFSRIIGINGICQTMELNDNRILKVFSREYIRLSAKLGADLEKKVLASEIILFSEEIVKPESIVYSGNEFLGYIVPKINGITYNQFFEKLSLRENSDLSSLSKRHYKLEQVLIRNPKIVFPDICSCDNIMLDEKDNFRLIDYDGFQIDNLLALAASTSLVDVTSSKYVCNDKFYKTIDMQSSIVLYYLSVFNIDLKSIGTEIAGTNLKVTLFDIFESLQLEDGNLYDITHKILSNEKECSFLEESIIRVSESYDMTAIPMLVNNEKRYIKKLIKKNRF